MIREYAVELLAVPEAEATRLRIDAAAWLAAAGASADAIQMLLAAGAADQLAAIVAKEGSKLLAAGQIATVLGACRAIPPHLRTAEIEQLEGEAQQIQGDWSAAMTCFQRAAAGRDALPAQLAWRIGLIHYLRGEPDAALTVYQRGVDDSAADPVEMALLLAWMSTAHWIRGDVEPCRELATRALAAATSCGDHRALAAAHTVMAMLAALDGDRRGNDVHYLLALRAAEEASDVLQVVRIRTNRGSHFMEEGSYAEALQELDVAVRLAELHVLRELPRAEPQQPWGDQAAHGSHRGGAGRPRGFTASLPADRLGHGVVSPAADRRDLQRARQSRPGARHARGGASRSPRHRAMSRALFRRSRASQRWSPARIPSGHGLSPIGRWGTEPGCRTSPRCSRRDGLPPPEESSARARDLADKAEAAARARHDRAGLADAIALVAVSASDPRVTLRRLAEAAAIWREVGNPLGEAKVDLVRASIDRGAGSAALRQKAERELEMLGVRAHQSGNVAAGLLAFLSPRDRVAVRVQSLGGFSVLRDGELVRVSEWQSKRARELLKLLIAAAAGRRRARI